METATRAYNRVAVKAQRDELIVNHLSLVRHVLGRLSAELPSGVDVENLEAAGALGLVEAANSFNAEQGVKFAAFTATACAAPCGRASPQFADPAAPVRRPRARPQGVPRPVAARDA